MAVKDVSSLISWFEKTTPNSLSIWEISIRWLSEVHAPEELVENSGPTLAAGTSSTCASSSRTLEVRTRSFIAPLLILQRHFGRMLHCRCDPVGPLRAR